MKARVINGVNFKSRSQVVREMLMANAGTDSEIAREAKVTPQTVYAIKMKMAGLK